MLVDIPICLMLIVIFTIVDANKANKDTDDATEQDNNLNIRKADAGIDISCIQGKKDNGVIDCNNDVVSNVLELENAELDDKSIDQLRKLKVLYDEGIFSEKEFQEKKKSILGF